MALVREATERDFGLRIGQNATEWAIKLNHKYQIMAAVSVIVLHLTVLKEVVVSLGFQYY